jgi:hypothetical protein
MILLVVLLLVDVDSLTPPLFVWNVILNVLFVTVPQLLVNNIVLNVMIYLKNLNLLEEIHMEIVNVLMVILELERNLKEKYLRCVNSAKILALPVEVLPLEPLLHYSKPNTVYHVKET